jgi:hypothetical protein
MNYTFPWYYKILDVPVLPIALEQQIWQQYHAPDREQFAISTNKFLHPELATKPNPGDVQGQRDGKTFSNCRGSRYSVNNVIHQWVNKNICQDWLEAGIYVIHGDQNHGTILPHTDQTRALSLLYLLDAGGLDVRTEFWQEKNYSVHREMKTLVGNYNLLDLLKSVQWPLKTWVLLNTNILHSVEQMITKRVHFQVSLASDPDLPTTYIELC